MYIKQRDLLADVTFPTEPAVVFLADYDDMDKAKASPVAGYPVVCVTACDPKSPNFEDVQGLCEDERIDNSKTEYRNSCLCSRSSHKFSWEVLENPIKFLKILENRRNLFKNYSSLEKRKTQFSLF